MLFQANDLLDKRIIDNGTFTPAISEGSVSNAIYEIVYMTQFSVGNERLKIKFWADKYLKRHDVL